MRIMKRAYTDYLTTASRLYELDPYEANDNNETPETIAETIQGDPLAVIDYLLDIIEDLQA